MGVRTAVLLYINPQYAYNTKSEWVKIITRSLVYPEEPVMMKSRKLTENLPRNIILTRISLQEQRRGSRRLVRHMTCCLMLRRSRFMISMVRMGSRGVWGVDHRLEGCLTLEMVQDSATLTMETPEPHFHSSLEGAILLLHSSLPIQGMGGTEGMDIDIEELIGGIGSRGGMPAGGQFGRPGSFNYGGGPSKQAKVQDKTIEKEVPVSLE